VYSERDGLELVLRITVALIDDNLETRQMLYILFNHQSTRIVHYTILSNYSICTKNSTLCPPATNHSYEYMLVSMYATLPGTIIEPLTGMARPAKG
jgi:BarA-like signal transduction histidine kinase